MDGFALLLGHLTGDYIVQNDWMAKNKVNQLAPCPGTEPKWMVDVHPADREAFQTALEVRNQKRHDWLQTHTAWQDARLGHLACTVHCLCYTLAVWAFTFWWMPWWGLLLCSAVHWPVDRFRLARWWMENVSGQAAFATGPLAPWSIIIVDNVFHLLTLYGIWLLAGVI